MRHLKYMLAGVGVVSFIAAITAVVVLSFNYYPYFIGVAILLILAYALGRAIYEGEN